MSTQQPNVAKLPNVTLGEIIKSIRSTGTHKVLERAYYYTERDIRKLATDRGVDLRHRWLLKAIKHNAIKPAGPFDVETHELIRVGGTPYSVPKTWAAETKRLPTKREELKKSRYEIARRFIENYFYSPGKYLASFTQIVTDRPVIYVDKQHKRHVHIKGPAILANYLKFSNPDNIVINKVDVETIDDMTISQVTVWEREDLRTAGEAFPKMKWMAQNDTTKSIASTRERAITGLNTRTRNKVAKTLFGD